QAGGAGHFVAVVAHGRGFAVVADPASGARPGLAAVLPRHYSGRPFVLDSPVAPTGEGTWRQPPRSPPWPARSWSPAPRGRGGWGSCGWWPTCARSSP